MIYRTYYLSPLGRILLAADDIGLIGVWFEGQKYFGEFPGHMNYVFEEKENHILKDALRWLDIYFSGQKPDFLPKLHLIGTDFQREGGAVGHNRVSVIVPCHRVIGLDGSLTGYAGGIERKIRLLNIEQPDLIRTIPKF